MRKKEQQLENSMDMRAIVVHYGEIGIKGKNRTFFENVLIKNIRTKLKQELPGINFSIKKRYGRILILFNKPLNDNLELIKATLSKIFGIAYFAPCYVVNQDIEKIKQTALKLLQKYQHKHKNEDHDLGENKPITFKVESRRSFKQFSLTSIELNKEIGAFLLENYSCKVDLHNPEIVIHVDIIEKEAILYVEKHAGQGGLPVGVSGKVISLISGGIDSPVASYLMMKRGCEVLFLHFHNFTPQSKAVKDKIQRIVKVLSQYQINTKLYMVPFAKLQYEIVKKVPPQYRMIIYRRIMLKIAEKLALKEKAKAIITGDSLAQVASQTLENLHTIYAASNLPVLAPLIGFDKRETINFAKTIGTYDLSILPYDDCCSFMIAKHPATKSKLNDIEEIEKGIDLSLIDDIIKNLKPIVIK